MEIVSIYTVTEAKTKEVFTEAVTGSGQEAIKFLRGEYPKFSRFILEGFEIDGNFKQLEV